MLSCARKRRYAARSVTCVIAATAWPPRLPTAADTSSSTGGAARRRRSSAPARSPRPAPRSRAAAAAPRARRARAADLRRAVLRLINQRARAQRPRPRSRANRRLARAAERHAADMARRNYFSHVSPERLEPAAARPRRGLARAAWARRSPGAAASQSRRRARSVARVDGQPAASRDHAWAAAAPSGIGYKRARGCSGGRVYWVAEVG